METETTLSQTEKVRAATNDPALSQMKVQLGDREFTVVDLPYDDYIKFLSMLQPLLEALAGKLGHSEFNFAGESTLTVSGIIKYCSKSLPEMVRIVCSQTDPDITIEEVKRLGKNPFRLATVVLKQVEQNRIIADIADFFVQILPMMAAVGEKANPKKELMTEETL